MNNVIPGRGLLPASLESITTSRNGMERQGVWIPGSRKSAPRNDSIVGRRRHSRLARRWYASLCPPYALGSANIVEVEFLNQGAARVGTIE